MPGHHHACDTRVADAAPNGEGEVVRCPTRGLLNLVRVSVVEIESQCLCSLVQGGGGVALGCSVERYKIMGQWSDRGPRTSRSEIRCSASVITRSRSDDWLPVAECRVSVFRTICCSARSSDNPASCLPSAVSTSAAFHCRSLALKTPRMTVVPEVHSALAMVDWKDIKKSCFSADDR